MNKKVVKMSLVDQVYSSIIDSIQDGSISQGERLNIEELAEIFGVSRTPVREAINRLFQEGFVEQQYNSGPRVAQFKNKQIIDIIKANTAIFDGVIESYEILDRKSYEELTATLSEIVAGQREMYSLKDNNEFYILSVKFHIALIEACTNGVMKKFALQTQHQINMCALHYQKEDAHRKTSLIEHEGILRALEEKDLNKAVILMKAHNRTAEKVLMGLGN